MIEDASGILTPERTRELIATVQRHCDGVPLEFHAHCNSGLAPLCYLEAVQSGVTTVHTAVAPLANGTSLPATETILKNTRRLGYASDLDEDALATVSAYFKDIAQKEGFPTGTPREYDLYHFEHQVPGGMMTNLTRQLRELGMEHRLDEILDEVIQVRKEFGYPVMATPYSQIVGVQAVENVVSGERYKKIPDETIKYALDYYGKPVVPIDPNVLDKIMNLPRTKEFINWMPEGFLKSVEELRQEIGPELSDDELLLKILIPGKPPTKSETKKRVPITSSRTEASQPEAVQPGRAGHQVLNATDSSREFNVEVDGEAFTVRISPLNTDVKESVTIAPRNNVKTLPAGAIVCDMTGLVLSLEVKVGDKIDKGAPIALIEAMKMRRSIHAPHSGTVKEIFAVEGAIIEAEDVLMLVV